MKAIDEKFDVYEDVKAGLNLNISNVTQWMIENYRVHYMRIKIAEDILKVNQAENRNILTNIDDMMSNLFDEQYLQCDKLYNLPSHLKTYLPMLNLAYININSGTTNNFILEYLSQLSYKYYCCHETLHGNPTYFHYRSYFLNENYNREVIYFTVLQHPYHRFINIYHYMAINTYKFKELLNNIEKMTIKDMLKYLKSVKHSNDRKRMQLASIFKPQYVALDTSAYDWNMKSNGNFDHMNLIKLERFKNDFQKFINKYPNVFKDDDIIYNYFNNIISNHYIDQVFMNSKQELSAYLDQEDKDLIYEIYQEDFLYFNYYK